MRDERRTASFPLFCMLAISAVVFFLLLLLGCSCWEERKGKKLKYTTITLESLCGAIGGERRKEIVGEQSKKANVAGSSFC